MFFLVVDDDALSRDILTVLLEAEGYLVKTVASGALAVEWVSAHAQEGQSFPDVILTDIQMPGLAGDALAIALKPLLKAGTLLLAMSGSQPTSSALKSFDGFLLKPFLIADLKSMISPSGAKAVLQEIATPEIQSTESPGAVALDEEIYSKMSELMPLAQLGQLYALCVDDARKRVAHMQLLAADGNDAEYRREAHAVKGGCGMIGAVELHELAARAEQEGLAASELNSGTSSVTAVLTQLSRACYRLQRILQERTRQ